MQTLGFRLHLLSSQSKQARARRPAAAHRPTDRPTDGLPGSEEDARRVTPSSSAAPGNLCPSITAPDDAAAAAAGRVRHRRLF